MKFSSTFFWKDPEFDLSTCCVPITALFASLPADAVAYAALLRNELLGAGIETVPDPHTDDRRHTVLSQDSHGLFRVRDKRKRPVGLCLTSDNMYTIIPECNSCFVTPPQYTVHTKRVPFDSDNEVSPYSLSPLSNKRYDASQVLHPKHENGAPTLPLADLFLAMFSSAATSCSAPLVNRPGRSPRSPSKCWTLQSCRMTSTSTW